ncbi:MAG TPA: hypothetical protein VLA37_03045, partial [Sphingomonadaceae bacterium]|nr:hypothetical protein [Sphingomonadaceae bacterium]
MIRNILLGGVAIAAISAAAPATAQNAPPPSPYVQRVDHPTCTRDELKQLTAAYVEAQRSGSLAGLPLHEKAEYLENMQTIEQADGLWNTALPIAHAMSFHDDTRCKTFTEIIVTDGPKPYVL